MPDFKLGFGPCKFVKKKKKKLQETLQGEKNI